MRTRAFMVAGLLAAVTSAGCLAAEPAGTTYGFGGAFTAPATQAEFDAFDAAMRERGGDTAFLESHPVQYRVTGMTAGACEDARAFAMNQSFVTAVHVCNKDPVSDP